MSLPEEQPTPEESASPEEVPSAQDASPEETPSGQEIFSEVTDLPEGFTPLGEPSHLPRARRRRAARMLVPPGEDERASLMDRLARRAFPSFEFFLFAFFCGAVLGAAYLLDSPALLLLGALLAPLLTPWVGMTLAIQTGAWRFFFLTMAGLLVASLLVFLTGALAGLAGHLWLPLPLFHANIHSHLWWPDLFLVALGAILLTIAFVRSEQKPILPSIMLAYGLFLPLSAGGVGWGLGAKPIWPDGALVFLAHLALSVLAGCITLAALRFKPAKAFGYLLPILLGLLSLAALVYLTGLTKIIQNEIMTTRRTVPTAALTRTIILPSITPTVARTPVPSATSTPTETLQPSATPLPTPAYAIITASSDYGGANIRSEPGAGTVLTVLSNGIIVEVLPEIQTAKDGSKWERVHWNTIRNLVEGLGMDYEGEA